jgi:transposase InsO family protein
MPWQEVSTVSLRQEFITLVQQKSVSVSELCRRYGVSRKTGYKWLGRYRREGPAGLPDRSRRPHQAPGRTPASLEAALVALRHEHPAWGARKLRRRLQTLGEAPVPACSTVTAILHRHGLIAPEGPGGRHAWVRFEHPVPNSLWQMDFKGSFRTLAGRCHPLGILDDHSRFNLCLRALRNEQTAGVQAALTATFQRYGLPDTLLADNGSPWGCDWAHPYTPLTVWLLRLGVGVSHGRPYHPQTQGKEERFHRTLETELLRTQQWRDLAHCQAAFDRWRESYNTERPHDALALAVPASRYQPSLRAFPATLPPIAYPSGMAVRRVQLGGRLDFHGRTLRVPKAFTGYPVGVQPTATDGVVDVWFCQHRITQLDLRRGV